ncbi:MAG: hypothetical protein WCW03_03130 [Candidatus Paceibacterota bacterium]|jgi:hypothetical protein
MTETQLKYARVSPEQLLCCLKLTVLRTRQLSSPEVWEIEEVVLWRMKHPTQLEVIPGLQGESVQTNPPPFDPERDLPGGLLPSPDSICQKCHQPITGDEEHAIKGERVFHNLSLNRGETFEAEPVPFDFETTD